MIGGLCLYRFFSTAKRIGGQLLCAGFALAALSVAAPSEATGVSTNYQVDAGHSGSVHFIKSISPPFRLLWSRDIGGRVSYPVVAKGMVFVTVNPGGEDGSKLYALSLRTGKTIWYKLLGGLYGVSFVVYDNGSLFVLNYNGQLEAVAADTGKLKWIIDLPDEYAFGAPLTVSGGHVFVIGGGYGGIVYSVDESDGHIQWMMPTLVGDGVSPAVGDGRVYATYPCQYYAFNQTSGSVVWQVDDGCEGTGETTPVFYEHRIYVRDSVEYRDRILDAATGNEVGSFNSWEAPAFFKDSAGKSYLVAVMVDSQLSCYDLSSGQLLWSFAGDGRLDSAPIVVNGMVVVGSDFGNVYVVDGVSGAQLWTANVGSSIPEFGTLGAGLGKLVVSAEQGISVFAPDSPHLH